MVERSKAAITMKFKPKYLCVKCGYIPTFAERTCPLCGGAIVTKIVKIAETRKVILA